MKTQCPSGHTLNVPDTVQGKKIRCKTCQQVFVVPVMGGAPLAAGRPPAPPPAHYRSPPPAPYPEPHEDDGAYDVPRPAAREDWQGLKVGLLLYQIRYIITVCVLGVWVLIVGMAILAGFTASMGLLMFVGILQIIAGVASLGAYIVGLVGAIFCIQIPPSTGYRGLAIALTSLEGAVVGLGLLAGLLLLAGAPVAYVLLMILAGLTAIAAIVVQMLFFRSVALINKQRSAASSAIVYMIMYLVAPVVFGILVGIVWAIARSGVNPRVPGIMMIVSAFVFLGFEIYLHVAIWLLVRHIRGGVRTRKKPAY